MATAISRLTLRKGSNRVSDVERASVAMIGGRGGASHQDLHVDAPGSPRAPLNYAASKFAMHQMEDTTMLAMMLSILLVGVSGNGTVNDEAQLLIDTIESLQQPVEDFRCEFEGTRRHKGPGSDKQKLGDDGLADSFSGTFAWKRGGDFRYDSLHRLLQSDTIHHRTLIVRAKENEAEQYIRPTDAPIGAARIEHPRRILRVWDLESPQAIFSIDELKYDVANGGHEASVEEGELDGRPVKILKIGFRNNGWPFRSYWIDLRRNGHVIRAELYWGEKHLVQARRDIKLARFKVANTEVWMPVSGEQVSYQSSPGDKNKLVVAVLGELHIVNETMEFNKHPGRDAFTMKYKPGTPISDDLRKLQYEFGQQSIRMRPTRAEAEKMLKDQLAQAERQKAELVVATPSQELDWTRWLVWSLGIVAVCASVALWFQRRRH